jgi:hypothetical protein
MPHSSKATYGGMAHGAVELTAVLTNLAPVRRRGEPCTHPGAASRVAVWEFPVWSSSVRRIESAADGRLEDAQQRAWRCLVVPGSHSARDGTAVPGMAAQRRDGRTRPKVTEETRSTGLMSRCCPARAWGRRSYLFRGFRRPLSRGATRRPYGSGRHSITELTLAFPHSSRIVPGMASRGGLAEQRRDMIPKRCQRAGVARILL